MFKSIIAATLAVAAPGALFAQAQASQPIGNGMGTEASASPRSPAGDRASGAPGTGHATTSHTMHRRPKSGSMHAKSFEVSGTADMSNSMTSTPR